ncbi:MAG TPA: hypothetical protein VEX60_05965 [Pyrinomonadaceae bacterium]|nr:hypothetical protein [Pyrinomonadaceae bacterium]
MSQTAESMQDELARRYNAAVRVVIAVFVLTALLFVLAITGALDGALSFNPLLANSLRLSVIFLGIGALVFRRTRFSAMRLRDIGALRGASGLLETLQLTTIYVALAGGAVALLGFVISLMTGDGKDMLYFSVIATAVLLYTYPRRAAWQSVVASIEREADEAEQQSSKGSIA